MFVWDCSFFTQYSYYCDFFCLRPALRLRDRHCHMWVRYIDTTKVTVWCISSIKIYMASLRFGIAKKNLWVIFQNGKTEYNCFNVLSIIATPFFFVAKSNLTHYFFLNYQQFIGKDCEIYKRVLTLLFYMQVSRIMQPVYICIGQPTIW